MMKTVLEFFKKYLFSWIKKIFCKIVCSDECEVCEEPGTKESKGNQK